MGAGELRHNLALGDTRSAFERLACSLYQTFDYYWSISIRRNEETACRDVHVSGPYAHQIKAGMKCMGFALPAISMSPPDTDA